MGTSGLADQRVLIAEDELLIAVDLTEAFEEAGAVILGPVSSIEAALSLLENEPDIHLGIVDLNLGGELAYPLAQALAQRNVPFMFSTGYDDEEISLAFKDVIRLTKPATGEEAVEKAESLLMLR
ncbi:response regulator [Novosphingobium rosa]|uniref:response regulator n=1 Tax=Novosphingobium rosa TaxID=76978 RepID=UPI0008318F8A|nr:response regulator [Novosphingobium rosa]